MIMFWECPFRPTESKREKRSLPECPQTLCMTTGPAIVRASSGEVVSDRTGCLENGFPSSPSRVARNTTIQPFERSYP